MKSDLREKHQYDMGVKTNIKFNNQNLEGFIGENLAAALYAANIKTLKYSPKKNMPRGVFCLIGSCQECTVLVNEKKVLACMTYVSKNMEVKTIDIND